MSIDDMNKFQEKEMRKIIPIKNTWYDWLINYIPEPIRKIVGGFKDTVISLFKTNIPKPKIDRGGEKLKKNLKKKIIINWKENLMFITIILDIKVMVVEMKTYRQKILKQN